MATDRTVLVRLKANVGDFVAGMSTARAAVRGVTSEIDTTNDRVAWLSQGILAIGPTLAPLGAAAIPLFTGIATQATIAAGAVGVMALAFSGVGDALKAVNDYQLEPTAANLEKVAQAMDQLGPAGAEFVMFLDSLGPQLHDLQLLARDGIFPGAQKGLEELMTLMPRARGLVSDLADTIGDLMAQAGGDIAGPRFEAFWDFLDRNARPILEDLARTVGNFASGFLNLLVAFEPESQRFSAGLLDMAQSFRQWTEGLGDNADFQAFLQYIDESIPKALEFGSALSEAFVAIITAAAPVGDVMLPLLTNILQVIAALADTPLGPIFLTAAAAMSVYGRAVAIANVTTSGLGKGVATLTTNLFRGTSGVKTLAADLRAMSTEFERAGKFQSTMLSGFSQTSGAAQRARASIGALGRSAALIGGLAVATSGLADGMGLTSTASLAVMGAMVGGVPGAAIGGLIGVTLDLRKAAGKAGEAQKQLAADMRAAGLDIAKQSEVVDSAFTRLQDHVDDLSSDSIGEGFANIIDPDRYADFFTGITGGTTVEDSLEEQAAMAEEKFGDIQLAARLLAQELGLLGDDGSASLGEMTAALNEAQPAMTALGITTDDLIAAVRDGSIMDLIGALTAWQTEADSMAGRTDAVVDAVSDLDNQLVSTADSASALANALDELLSPQLNLDEATDEWVKSLRTLNDDLAKNSKTLVGNSKQALQNRAAVRDRVRAMQDVLTAEAEAGASAGKLSGTLQRQRRALIEAGEAAGISKKQMREYINTLGLTPELVKTLIQNNAGEAKAKADDYYRFFKSLDGKAVQQYIDVYRRTHGGGLQGQKDNPNLATGGYLRGPGTGTSDSIPAWLSDGEYVVRAKAVEKYGVAMFHRLNAMAYATGGKAGQPNRANFVEAHDSALFVSPAVANLIDQFGGLAAAIKGFTREMKRAEQEVSDAQAARDAIVGMMDQLGQTVRSQLRSDIFASPTNPWQNQGSDVDRLNADTAMAEEEGKLIESLSGKGLSGAALAEVIQGGITKLRAYDQLSSSDLQAYVAAFDRREKALAAVSSVAGTAAYGGDLTIADARLAEANDKLDQINENIKTLNREQKQAQKENADSVTAGVNGAAGKGKRHKVYNNGGRGGRR